MTCRQGRLGWGVAGCLLLALIGWLAVSDAMRAAGWLTIAYLAAGVVFVGTMWRLRHSVASRGVPVWIVGAGLAMRAVCFTEPARHESDFHRYLWEGALVANGHNPYTIQPKDAPDRAELAALVAAGKPTLEQVNHSYLTSIYPPVAQAVFALAYRLAPYDTVVLRAVFLAFDVAVLALVLLVLRRLGKPLHQAAIYWWNPIVVKEFYVAAHMDAVVIALAFAAVTAALWHWRHRAMLLLGVAMGAKLWPVVLAPFLLRHSARGWKSWVTGGLLLGVVATGVLWPLVASWQLGKDSGLHAYSKQWTNNAGFFTVAQWAAHRWSDDWHAAENMARVLAGGLLVAWTVWALRRPIRDEDDFLRRGLGVVAGLFLLSPTQFPWYYTWLVPFLAMTPSWPLLLYTALLPLYHLHYEHKWVLWIEHLPVWVLLLWSCRSRRAIAATGAPYQRPRKSPSSSRR